MASLTGASIASSYTSLLKLSGNTDTLVAGNNSNAIQVVDGNGDASPLYLNTDRLGIGGQPTNPLSVTGAVDMSSSLAIGGSTITTSGGNTPQIQTHKTNNSNGLGIFQWGNNGAHSAMLSLSHSKSGTIGSHTILADNDAIGTIQFNGSDGTNFDTLGASIHVEVDGTPAANRIPSAMIFSTSAVSDDGITERLRIDSSGLVGIGIASPDTNLHIHKASAGDIAGDANVQLIVENNTHVGMQFLSPDSTQAQILFGNVTDGDIGYINYNHSNHALTFATNTGVRLTIAADGTFTGSSSNDISDERLKENITDIDNGLDTINKLQGRTFTWKEEADMSKGTKYGLIAQELEKVLPDLVYNESGIRQKEDGEYYKSVTMNGIIPVLIEAVKELSAKVTELESKLK